MLYIHYRLFSSLYVAPADYEKTVKYIITECNIITQNCMLPNSWWSGWSIMSKAAQLYGWTQWTKITFCISHTHTHTIKIDEVRTNRVKTEYGMGQSVYGWGQCGRGLRTVHGWGQYEWESQQYHGRICIIWVETIMGAVCLYGYMGTVWGIAWTKPTNYPMPDMLIP